jgi:leucyl aminopeptidase
VNPFSTESIIRGAKSQLAFKTKKLPPGISKNKILVLGNIKSRSLLEKQQALFSPWQWTQIKTFTDPVIPQLQVEGGTWSLVDLTLTKEKRYTPNQLKNSDYGWARDRVGSLFHHLKYDFPTEIEFVSCNREQVTGTLVGLGLASYTYQGAKKRKKKFDIYLNATKTTISNNEISKAIKLFDSINLARHLVNLPANILGPQKYVELAKKIDSNKAKIQILGPGELRRKGFGLICGVGQGSNEGPFIVQIKYRKGPKNQKPIAIIGKGITFDSGGLDIKPANFMRTMKKDMGGSASVLATADCVLKYQMKLNCDFYLGIAENSISQNSFRPGDILISKKGLSVEIHNTDAEGRLVLADVITWALSQKEKPREIIDVATLTGAVKMGLGAYLPGLFSNDASMAKKFLSKATKKGEPLWELPLDPQLESQLETNVADLVNSSDGYGGAISAALFLERFVEEVKWSHFDIYAWTDSPRGAFIEKGGTGQMVQTLIEYLGD